jgi:exodeoxyribonuclease VII small subunit
MKKVDRDSAARSCRNFEGRLAKLEEVEARLRSNNLPLDEALAAFEEGVSLARSLEHDLEKVDNRIQQVMNAPDTTDDTPSDIKDAPTLTLFDI